jgi:hypothetical protein
MNPIEDAYGEHSSVNGWNMFESPVYLHGGAKVGLGGEFDGGIVLLLFSWRGMEDAFG